MAEPVYQTFRLVTDGEHPEIDKIGVMWECLRDCDQKDACRILTYLIDRVRTDLPTRHSTTSLPCAEKP